ncbi:MAG: FeoB-associated Cys-rich membrane protein [Lachnospiraceae bacterium]|nr:FeoB-associated Cys-rich membrane protein [Lachnospiraceae bacterium]
MISFLTNNIGTIIVLVILLLVVLFAVKSIISDKKKGKSSCGGNCAHCAMGGTCHGK